MEVLEKIITQAFSKKSFTAKEKKAVLKVIDLLDQGKLRVCEKKKDQWLVHQWIKKSILLYFKIKPMKQMKSSLFSFYDKIPLKSWTKKDQVRVVPQALVRRGSFVGRSCILMPSYINIGAYVGEGCLIDTWATVGSCAQLGSHIHVSGGVGIGGVLEPLQAEPVIIEDHVFLGSRSVIVEGVLVKKRAVIASGVVLTASTPIIDVRNKKEKVYKKYIPENAVVIPGTRKKVFNSKEYYLPCALIIGERKKSTNEKTALNDTLRHFAIS